MSIVAEHQTKSGKANPASVKEGPRITVQTVIMGLLAVSAAVLLAYQIFGCADCYI